jgi:hypothetical protein
MAARKQAPGPAAAHPGLALLAALDHPHKAGIVRLRGFILGIDARISEEIKWNAPSFRIDEHFATFRLHPPRNIQLVLHTGAKAKANARTFAIDDPCGLLSWPASDRCVLTLASEAELDAHEAAVVRILEQWISQLGDEDGGSIRDREIASRSGSRPRQD